MHLLITSATFSEINPLLKFFDIVDELKPGDLRSIKVQNHEIDFFITGPGLMLSSYFMGQQLGQKRYDLCLQAGIAGAFGKSQKIGENVFVKTETLASSGAEDGRNFLDLFEMGLIPSNFFPFSNGRLNNENLFPYSVLNSIRSVDAITVDTVHGDDESISKTIARHNPQIESMEGAPFFFGCLQRNIPFMEIRCISNYVERRNKSNWNIPLAVEELNKLLIRLVEEITA